MSSYIKVITSLSRGKKSVTNLSFISSMLDASETRDHLQISSTLRPRVIGFDVITTSTTPPGDTTTLTAYLHIYTS
jgi:hypothetical protein